METGVSPRYFAPELWYLIIEHLAGRTRDLRACSLISRSPSPVAQALLFRNIRFQRPSLGFDTNDYDDVAACRRLADALINSPHLVSYIHHIVFRLNIEIVTLLSGVAFPNLREIGLLGDELTHIDDSVIELTQSMVGLPTIRRLEFSNFDSLGALSRLCHHSSPDLNALSFDNCWLGGTASPFDLAHMVDVDLPHLGKKDEHFNRILLSSRLTIKRLALCSFSSHVPIVDAENRSVPTLGQFIALTHLEIRCMDLMDVFYILQFLSGVKTDNKIQEILFSLDSDINTDISSNDDAYTRKLTKAFDAGFVALPFPALKRVEIREWIPVKQVPPLLSQGVLQELLPALNTAGLLFLSWRY
ncbi:hypothetical protein B0H10DRAFT_1958094 [Mycena sp. CBHHK59/15]|nr:hypothetical protein B0H10DRAFT_1958094 [Mycena sp. CBHHK59/15]